MNHIPTTGFNQENKVRIVGVGASAGGLEALELFFSHMPIDSGLAFVVIQHLSPDHRSMMRSLLSKRTKMKVLMTEDCMKVEPNHVYLIPPSVHLTVFKDSLIVTSFDRDSGLNLPVDTFFESLAEDQKEKAIGVVLSGTGSDGSRGVRAIKEKLGMVMVQDEATAAFDGMPKNALVAAGGADFVLAPEEMGQSLVKFIKYPAISVGSKKLIDDSETGVVKIFSLLRRKLKIDFSYYKTKTLYRRIERRIAVNRLNSLQEYVALLSDSPSELNQLHQDLLIGVTRFFRDKEYWASLESNLRSTLENNEKKELRIWVAACSTGEEAYTVALVIQELLDELNSNIPFKVFATDVSQVAINAASNGIYSTSISADVPEKLYKKYIVFHEDNVSVSADIRKKMVFAKHDLLSDPPFTNVDLITCRNMLIYINPVMQQKIIELFNFSLNAGGLLMLGSSETLGDMEYFFESLDHKIFKSKGKRKVVRMPNSDISHTMRSKQKKLLGKVDNTGEVALKNANGVFFERLSAAAQDLLPVSLVVNEGHELLHVLGDTSELLFYPNGRVVNSVTKIIHKDLVLPVSTGIRKVISNGENVDYHKIRIFKNKDESTLVSVSIRLLPKKMDQDALIAIFIQAVSNHAASIIDIQENSADSDINAQLQQNVIDLEQELHYSRESLKAAVEELETSNEELQATNEELLASNEELQSTNEELHSVNEELYTVNAEYQRKITELVQTKNDLNNLLDSTGIGSLFLDENLDIRRYTPKISEVINLISQDIGRPLRHVTNNIDIDYMDIIETVVRTQQPESRLVTSQKGVQYELRILPYRITEKISSGIVMTLIEINR